MDSLFYTIGISRISPITRWRASGSAPVNTVAPVASGTFSAGQTVSCTTGTWTSDAGAITYGYQWVKNSSPVSGATSSTYVLTAGDTSGAVAFWCTVTATNTAGSASATSNSIAVPPP